MLFNESVILRNTFISSDRYSDNGNLSLRGVGGGVQSLLDRSSSGSSHGSGSGSGSAASSGYQSQETLSELTRERRLIKETCQVELEDSDQEDPSQVVTVTGGLHLGPGAITNKVRGRKNRNMKHDPFLAASSRCSLS